MNFKKLIFRTLRFAIILVSFFFITLFLLPNVFNTREKQHFTGKEHLERANSLTNKDSITISTSTFYSRNALVEFFLGTHYRNLWSLEVKYPVYQGYDSLEIKKIGGGMQTISVEYEDQSGRHYSFRSVDKDQSSVLPNWLQASGLRTLVRDQTSALNPFAAKVVTHLSKAVDIPHLEPTYFIMPADDITTDSSLNLLAGHIATLTPELGGSWENDSLLNYPKYIWNTDELLQHQDSITFDAQAYLKCRLFDMLISDWDRHEGQWKWLIFEQNNKLIARPYPLDRDMAFCRFDDGLVNSVAVNFANRFQSFRSNYESVQSIASRLNDLDKRILKNITAEDFKAQATYIQRHLNEDKIEDSFNHYPTEVPESVIDEHVLTLANRLKYLQEVAVTFHGYINK